MRSYGLVMKKVNRSIFIITILYIGFVCSCIILPAQITLVYSIFLVCTLSLGCLNNKSNPKAIAYFLTFPVFISAVQNIYLGLGANHLNTLSLQVALTINIGYIWMVIVFLILRSIRLEKKYSWLIGLIIIVLLQAAVLFLIYPTTIASFLSSLRNILAPLTILLFSLYFSRFANRYTVFKYFDFIIVLVLIFCITEYFIGNKFWVSLNIAKLWNLKGMNIGFREVPGNFYSSEMIAGHQLRRMASSFADPVNLGTFLFTGFVLSWYQRKKILSALILIACVLTVSKGALLEILIFIIIYSFVMDKKKIIAPVAFIGAFIFAMMFYNYSQTNSSGSMNAHINGFISSLKIPFRYPFGMGVGNVGVLASKLGSFRALDVGVFETGIGMVLGQLGFIGLVIYIIFFYKLIKHGKQLDDKRDKILWYSLILGILANAIFNEVALSPNSCGMHFILLGLINNKHFNRANYE